MAINFNNNINTVAIDNVVMLNNQLKYMLTDDEVLKIQSILEGMVSSRNGASVEAPVEPTPVNHVSQNTVTPDLDAKWNIQKYSGNVNGKKKTLFCIRYGFYTGKSKYGNYRCNQVASRVANKMVRSIGGILTVVTDDGYRYYGFAKKEDAEKAIATLPKKISGADIDKNRRR